MQGVGVFTLSTAASITDFIEGGKMSARLLINKEDGNLLIDTEKITYGLLKSGYLELLTMWPRLDLRSGQLDPSSPSSWKESTVRDSVFGFSVSGAVAPIVFISGLGSACGSSKSGDTTTFYFIGATTATKYYYFDTMRNTIFGAGLKCYDEAGVLTFNSLQRPLNIVATVTAPNRPAQYPGLPGYYTAPYIGASVTNGSISPGAAANVLVRVTVPLAAGEYAASISFSRSAGMGARDSYYPYLMTIQEGAGGVSGGVQFMFCVAARTTELISNSYPNGFFNIPVDRYPTALVIRTEDLPFPFN